MAKTIETVSGLLGNIGMILVSLKSDKEIRNKRQKKHLLNQGWKNRKKLEKLFAKDGLDAGEVAKLKEFENKLFEAAMDLL